MTRTPAPTTSASTSTAAADWLERAGIGHWASFAICVEVITSMQRHRPVGGDLRRVVVDPGGSVEGD
jgi:hypothetical protein